MRSVRLSCLLVACVLAAGCAQGVRQVGAPSPVARPGAVSDSPELPAAPIAGRVGHAAVWTGDEMLIWGGMVGGDPAIGVAADGAAYDPVARSWRMLPPAPLAPRSDAAAVWTGDAMVVWGGSDADGLPLPDGAAYHPAEDAWELLPAAPIPQSFPELIWTGRQLVLLEAAPLSGLAYDPSARAWTTIPAAPFDGAYELAAAWIGDRLVALASRKDDRSAVLASWDPASGAWSPPEQAGIAKGWFLGPIWDGRRILFVNPGVELLDGGPTSALFDPATRAWTTVNPLPEGVVAGYPRVWTGDEVVFVGMGADDAAAYDPDANAWRSLASPDEGPRHDASAVWADGTVLVWGGNRSYEGADLRADGFALAP